MIAKIKNSIEELEIKVKESPKTGEQKDKWKMRKLIQKVQHSNNRHSTEKDENEGKRGEKESLQVPGAQAELGMRKERGFKVGVSPQFPGLDFA